MIMTVQEPITTAAPVTDRELITQLVRHGINNTMARELVKQRREEVARQLEVLPFRESVKNQTGYLIQAIREAYPLPIDLEERKATVERQRKTALELADKRAKEAHKEHFMRAYFTYLSDEMIRLREAQDESVQAFDRYFSGVEEHLGEEAEHKEMIRLHDFQYFVEEHQEMGTLAFWAWDSEQNPERYAAALPADSPVQEPASAEAEEEPQEEKKAIVRSKKVDVIDLVQESAVLFHDEDHRHYATVNVNSHVENYPIESKSFRVWLSGLYFEKTGVPLFGDTLKEACATLQALAQYSGEEKSVYLRLAEHDGKIYLDLSDRLWRMVEISADGWRVIAAADAPIRFCRRNAMLPLPEPVSGGRLDELRSFMNAGDDATWALIASWLVMTLHPNGPYPILSVTGEQGSAKSTASKLLRSLVDPNRADLRATPKDERDLMIAASNSWVLAFDNLSGLTQELSDSLCRIATGAGFATRTLHSDTEETIFSVKRPILTNGIVDTNAFPDLLDRSVPIFLRAIGDEKRREEHELWKGFHLAKPRILGALLSAVCHALQQRDAVTLTRRPRMADFARWAVAAEQGAGLREGAFMKAYDSNRSASNEMALDTPLAVELRAFMDQHSSAKWSGTATELHRALNGMLLKRNENLTDKNGWPKSANVLSGKLRRIAPNLRATGLDVDCGRTNGGSKIFIERTAKSLTEK